MLGTLQPKTSTTTASGGDRRPRAASTEGMTRTSNDMAYAALERTWPRASTAAGPSPRPPRDTPAELCRGSRARHRPAARGQRRRRQSRSQLQRRRPRRRSRTVLSAAAAAAVDPARRRWRIEHQNRAHHPGRHRELGAQKDIAGCATTGQLPHEIRLNAGRRRGASSPPFGHSGPARYA